MSRNPKKNKKQTELPPINKYINENMIENLNGKVKNENAEVERLKAKLLTLSTEIRSQGVDYIQETAAIEKTLQDKVKQNIYLNAEISQIRQDRVDFEANLKEDFERKFEIVKAEQKEIIEKVHEEMAQVRTDLETKNLANNELKTRVEALITEVDKLNQTQLISIENYERKIRNLTDSYRTRLQSTTEIFEGFLQDNKELITTDLFTIYRNLKKKFDIKIQECLDYKERNDKLIDENKAFRFSIDNDEGMLNQLALKQVQSNKKVKNLEDILNHKNAEIAELKNEYIKKFNDVNDKFMLYMQENDAEKKSLQLALVNKTKEIDELKDLSKNILNQRSDVETFFIEAIKDVKKEIMGKRKELERKSSMYPLISRRSIDSGLYITSVKPVEVKDLDAQQRETILLSLYNKIHEGKITKNFAKLRKLVS